MRFLADHDVYFKTVQVLRGGGHDVVTATEAGLSQSEDTNLLRSAHEDSRVLITRDRDFGNLVFAEGARGGVLYLRMSPSTENVVHEELLRVLGEYSEDSLCAAFVVVEPGRHRVRPTNR